MFFLVLNFPNLVVLVGKKMEKNNKISKENVNNKKNCKKVENKNLKNKICF
jgi:hypothetical protein